MRQMPRYTSKIPMIDGWYVYRIWELEETHTKAIRCLYIGRSENVTLRLESHKYSKRFPVVFGVDVASFPNSGLMDIEELIQIKIHAPLFNKLGKWPESCIYDDLIERMLTEILDLLNI